MAECAFQKKECNEKCALYIKNTKDCAIVTIAAILERVNNMGVIVYEKYLKGHEIAEYDEEDPMAKAFFGMLGDFGKETT